MVKDDMEKNIIKDHDDFMYRMYMCRRCVFYINNECSKNRIIRICARQGLKNRE